MFERFPGCIDALTMHSSQSSKALTEASRARAAVSPAPILTDQPPRAFTASKPASSVRSSPAKRRLAQESRNHPALVGLFWLDLKHPFAALDCILIRRLRNQPLEGAQSACSAFWASPCAARKCNAS